MTNVEPAKRGRGRPTKASASLVNSAESRLSLELAEQNLDREEAEFLERRSRLRQKKEEQRTRCANLLGEGLLQLATTDAAYEAICLTIIDRLATPGDRDLVASWMPAAKSAPPIEPSATASK